MNIIYLIECPNHTSKTADFFKSLLLAIKLHLSAFTSEYVKAPADNTNDRINPAKISSI